MESSMVMFSSSPSMTLESGSSSQVWLRLWNQFLVSLYRGQWQFPPLVHCHFHYRHHSLVTTLTAPTWFLGMAQAQCRVLQAGQALDTFTAMYRPSEDDIHRGRYSHFVYSHHAGQLRQLLDSFSACYGQTHMKKKKLQIIINWNFGGLWPLCSSSCGGCGGPLGPLPSVGDLFNFVL